MSPGPARRPRVPSDRPRGRRARRPSPARRSPADASPVASRPVLEWLLEPSEPSVRYRTLIDLQGVAPDDPEVVEARRQIGRIGWAAGIFAEQRPDGYWESSERTYRPKYRSTNWRLLVLADLGVPGDHPRLRRILPEWRDRSIRPDGGFAPDDTRSSHLCYTGNLTRALLQFSGPADPAVAGALGWLVRAQKPSGGWHCWAESGSLDAWEAMSAFAELPAVARTPEVRASIARGAEFYLTRRLLHQGGRYDPWYRFHYPVHYYYDALVGLEFLTALGYGGDPRLDEALALLNRRRGSDGRWRLAAAHADVVGPLATWFRTHPGRRPVPWTLEPPGEPSKWITYRALRVLARVAQAKNDGAR